MKSQAKTALIIGVNGQDGTILFNYLSGFKYRIIGVGENNIKTVGIKLNQKLNISRRKDVFDLVKKIKPDEIYYLAAFHHSSQDKNNDFYEEFKKSYEVNVFAFENFLEAIRLYSIKSKIFYASSSLIFGNCQQKKQNEETPYKPDGLYGMTKMDGMSLCRLYRDKFNVFAASGILYNHESEYRTENFISMKIIKSALNIKKGKQKELIVGDLSASVDWGYAYDYVKAMRLILGLKIADDFIIATGKTHTVLDFVKESFKHCGLDWQKYVKENKNIIKEKKTILIGDSTKLRRETNWEPSVNFSEMIKKIIDKLD